MSKNITITSTILSIFLLTILTIGLQNNERSIFAQESEIETVNATDAQQTDAQQTDAQQTDAQQTDAQQAGNATGGQQASNATKEKPDAASISVGESFAQQGTLTSKQDPLPGHEAHQLALILPPRADSAIYEGTLTFTSSKPTEVVILQNFANETAVDEFYGGVATAPLGEGTVAISLLTPQFGPIASASIPFAGNALALHNIEGEPFAATYTVSGSVQQPQTYNEILTPPVTETTEEEAEDGGDGGGDGGGDDDGDGGGDDDEDEEGDN